MENNKQISISLCILLGVLSLEELSDNISYASWSLYCIVHLFFTILTCGLTLNIGFNPKIKSNQCVKIGASIIAIYKLIAIINWVANIATGYAFISFSGIFSYIYSFAYLIPFLLLFWSMRIRLPIKIVTTLHVIPAVVFIIAQILYDNEIQHIGPSDYAWDNYLAITEPFKGVDLVIFITAFILSLIWVIQNKQTQQVVAKSQFSPMVPPSNLQEPQHKIITKIPHKKI